MTTKVLDYPSALVADDDSIPLTGTALPIVQDAYSGLDLQAELAATGVLVARIENRTVEGTPAVQHLRLLSQFFYRELGLGPNASDYYNPGNSYLNAMLQSRRGIPIPLTVLLMEIGQQIGLPLKSVFFPDHSLMRMNIPVGEVVLDPLMGQTLSREELQDMLDPYLEKESIGDLNSVPLGVLLQAATYREVIARMLCNLKAIYLQESHWQRLLAVQQRLAILFPDSIEEVHDWGLACVNLECFRSALEDFEAYVDARPDATDMAKLKERISMLRAISKSLS